MNAQTLFAKVVYRLRMEFLWRLPLLAPVDPKKVVCSNFTGRGYADNPAAIIDELLHHDPTYRIIWIVSDYLPKTDFPVQVTQVKIDSLRAVFHMRTAGFWIDNCRKLPFVRKRAGQRYIQTWHGFPLKKIEKDAADKLDAGYIKMAERDSRLTDVMVSNSAFLTNVYKTGFWYGGEVLEAGSPRNDVFFGDTRTAASRIKQQLGIPASKQLLLYAPTFRKDQGLDVYDLDYTKLIAACQKRFGGDWVVVLRLHPSIAKQSARLGLPAHGVYDASAYPDTQLLMVAADALITDYSSVMFDFMLSRKPVFLYANDISAYLDDRGFYYGMDQLPFELAETQQALHGIIDAFSQRQHNKRIDAFIKAFGFKEYGTAAASVVRWMRSQ